jgi:pSer/pThr/pTyr-binding forkhead associated (FHA) protein
VVVTCPSCGKKYRLEEKHFKGRDSVRFTCPQCAQAMEVARPSGESGENGAAPKDPPSTQKVKKMEGTWTGSRVPDEELLAMPEGRRVSLAVLQGNDAGQIFVVTKPVFTIGRADADLVLKDNEVSRTHAQLEVKGEVMVLRDLKSTNGTYLNEQRITAVNVENQTEFRLGSTTLMLIVTDATT